MPQSKSATETSEIESQVVIEANLSGLAEGRFDDFVAHVFCYAGSCKFKFNETPFTLVAGNSMIVTLPRLISDISESANLSVKTIYVHNDVIRASENQSIYGIQGTFLLFLNPVIRLSKESQERCKHSFENVEYRLSLAGHQFFRESLICALRQLFFDFFDFQIAELGENKITAQVASIVSRFLGMLEGGAFREHRELSYYAKELCVTDKYLSEICKKASGFAANYWINRFTHIEINRLLKNKELSIAQISDKLNFSSPAYFTRYVKNAFGKSPQEMRE
jgi:AraC-like DNA-binding protein